MAKKTVFVCGECGYGSGKWLGCCPSCNSWNTMVEESQVSTKQKSTSQAKAVPLSDVEVFGAKRTSTKIGELDRVLGGGVVAGSVILLGGDPGIGKSTLLLQTAVSLSSVGKVLYVTGEESSSQIKLRSERLSIKSDMLLLAENDLNAIEAEALRVKPDYLIIDSIQTMFCPDLSSAQGSVSQVREATTILTRFAKTTGAAVFIVGHVTKEGAIAGPRVLEHMVDTVLYFEGDRHDTYRLLRSVKNRYGSTNEIGVFEMRDSGMVEVENSSMIFLSGLHTSGSAITCAMEGTRPMLAEVQSLISTTSYANPRRMSSGIDTNRLVLLLAVLEKKAKLKLYDKDVYMNVIGGLRLEDRACDLAAILAIASALSDRPIAKGTAIMGEVALTGEVRHIGRLDKRIQECARLGFDRIIAPISDLNIVSDANIIQVRDINEAIVAAFPDSD